MHESYGEQILPDICNSFPQQYKEIGEDILLNATISCPAVAYKIMDDQEDYNFEVTEESGVVSVNSSYMFYTETIEYIDSFENTNMAVMSLYEVYFKLYSRVKSK